MRGIIVSAALLGLGVTGGYLLHAPRAESPERFRVVRESVERPVIVAGRSVSEETLRRIVREELATRSAAEPGTQRPASPAPSLANPAAFDEGMQLVHHAIAQRQWTPEDATALAHVLDTASPEQSAELLRTLVPAINRGEIKLTQQGNLF
jgi:hypothetical protein